MGLVMKQLVALLLGYAALAMLTGCSSSTAAPVQKVPDTDQATASLAPREDVAVSDNPIKIPEGRKSPPVVIAKSSASSPKKQEQAEQGDDQIQAVDYEQDSKQDNPDKENDCYSYLSGYPVDAFKVNPTILGRVPGTGLS